MSAVTQLKPKAQATKASATITPLSPQPRKGLALPRWTRSLAVNVLPPLVVLLVILAVWEVAFSAPGANLPTPSTVWVESSDLILDPFYVYGSQDIGLGWRVLTSLERVAYGFGFASIIGILVGAIIGHRSG